MALQLLLVVALLALGEPAMAQTTDMYDSTDMYGTTDGNQYDTGMSNAGNPPANVMNPTNVNSASGNGSEIMTNSLRFRFS